MKVTTEKIPESQVALNVEVEPEVVNKAVDKAYRRLAGKMNIPGFRRGKAPRNVVERMIGSEALWQEGLDDLLPEAYREALEQSGVEPIGDPQVDVAQQEPLILKFVVPVRPSVELADYHSIKVPRVDIAIDEAQVSAAIEQLRESRAKWIAVDRPAEVGDQVKVDVEGWVGASSLLYSPAGETLVRSADSETIIDSKDVKVWVSPDNRYPVPGFAEQLVGVKAGELKEFTLTIPEDFPQKEYANRSVAFKVNVHEVEAQQLPELNDEFAKEVSNGETETMEQFTGEVRKQLQDKAEQEAEHQLQDTVVKEVTDQSQVELPPQLVEREIDRMVNRLSDRLKNENASLEQYYRMTGQTEEQLREQLRDEAIRNLKTMFVLDKVADQENVTVSDEEIDERVGQMSQMFGEQAEEIAKVFNSPERRENLSFDLRTQKTVDLLVKEATEGTEKIESAGGEESTPEGPAAEGTAGTEADSEESGAEGAGTEEGSQEG